MKIKTCAECGQEYTPTGTYSKFCSKSCRDATAWRRSPRYVGCGSGGNQGHGLDHHSYKTGIATYSQHRKSTCERCGSVLNLCVHHKDQDRTNNTSPNLETLCKRCHQLEHGCTMNLPKEMSPEKRKWQVEHMKRLNKTLPRDSFGWLRKYAG